MRQWTVTAALLVLSTAAFAHGAERGEAKATIGGKQVVIDYGRPQLKGRALADLLKQLPEERIWRAGVDRVTTLTTAGDVMIGGKKVSAGTYTLYMLLPEDGSRVLLVNSDAGQPLKTIFPAASPERADLPYPHIGDYQKTIVAKEVARIPLQKEATPAPVDTFTVELSPAKDGSGLLKLSWGEESWSVEVKPAR